MKAVFVDTMGWHSLFDRRDAWHEKAATLMQKFRKTGRPLLTTDYVVDETATLLLMRGATRGLEAFLDAVESSHSLTVTPVGPVRFQEALAFFRKRRDQGYSFTDVTSFLVMRELRIREALTHDEHFEREGFTRLLV